MNARKGLSMNARRFALLGAAAGALWFLAGCATAPPPDLKAEAPYCHRNNKGRIQLCMKGNAPSLERDADAKRFEPSPTLLTVYVVRQAWSESGHALEVSLNGRHSFETLPESMLRLRLPPGEHKLEFTHDGQTRATMVRGAAGQVVFAGVAGTDWTWGSSHGWSDEPAETLKRRALGTRLVGDFVGG